MLNSLKVQTKLAVLCSAFLLPIALLAYLFVTQTEKEITFAAKELEGVRYIATLETELSTIVAVAQGAAQPGDLVPVLAQTDEVDRELGVRMNATETAAAASSAVRAAMEMPHGSTISAYDQAINAVLEHITRVQDGSNLTLDPELDSYYVQDLVAVKLPAVVLASHRTLVASLPVITSTAPSPSVTSTLLARKSDLSTVLAGIDSDITAATRGNSAGRVKVAIDPTHIDLSSAAGTLLDILDKATLGGASRPSIAEFNQAEIAFIRATEEMKGTSIRLLSDLLTTRIHQLRQKMTWSLTLTVLVLLASLIGAWYIARSINRPVLELVGVMERMAAGDLSAAMPEWNRQDEIGVLARSAAAMRRHLHDLANGVRLHTEQVRDSTDSIAKAVQAEAAISSEMSASVTEITSTMEEFSTSSVQIAEHAEAVAQIANQTWDSARNGVEAMQALSERMTDIQADNAESLKEIIDLGTKSKEISQVMRIINTIADQTKLIAFNAALEASSAGEAGRRFGVVAAEIRRLADSVTESTSEIEANIEHIQEAIQRLVISSEKGANNISSGMSAASETVGRMDHLAEAAQQTADAAQQISLSTQQQKSASAQVVVALREIVAASAHTAHSIEQISATSQTMTQLTADLGAEVGRFALEGQKPEARSDFSRPEGSPA